MARLFGLLTCCFVFIALNVNAWCGCLECAILTHVKTCIEKDEAVDSKDEMLSLLDSLRNQGSVVETGGDDLRVKFVTIQSALEHVLACEQAAGVIDQVVCVIHTPTPPTPLCMYPNEGPTPGLLDSSIAEDPRKLYTVQSRAQTLREILLKGGTIYAVYPVGGLAKRTAEQQKIYQEMIAQFPNGLMDWGLYIDSLPADKIGATCFFRDHQGHSYAYSIQATQANSPQQESVWGLWFGNIEDEVVSERVTSVFDYLDSVGGPDIRREVGSIP